MNSNTQLRRYNQKNFKDFRKTFPQEKKELL